LNVQVAQPSVRREQLGCTPVLGLPGVARERRHEGRPSAGRDHLEAGCELARGEHPLQRLRATIPAEGGHGVNEQALVSLKLKKTVDVEVGRTFAVLIEGG